MMGSNSAKGINVGVLLASSMFNDQVILLKRDTPPQQLLALVSYLVEPN